MPPRRAPTWQYMANVAAIKQAIEIVECERRSLDCRLYKMGNDLGRQTGRKKTGVPIERRDTFLARLLHQKCHLGGSAPESYLAVGRGFPG